MALEVFKSKLRDFARANMFSASIELPPALSKGNASTISITNELIKAINIPEESLGEIKYHYMGQSISLPGDKNFGQLTMTLYDDINLETRSLFYEWHTMLYNYQLNTYRDDISNLLEQSKIVVNQLDRQYLKMNSHIYHKVWPTSVSDMQYQNETENAILEYTVSFAYAYSEYKFNAL